MSDQHEPSPAELERTARTAREQLLDSLNRLEQRTKHMAHTAVNVTAVGGWSVAAACAFFISMSLARRTQRAQRAHTSSTLSIVLRTAVATAGMVASGVLVYSAQRRARALAELGYDVSSTPRLTNGNASSRIPASIRPSARA